MSDIPAECKLTIGMATYDDFHGAYMTIQSLRLLHPNPESAGKSNPLVEILVLDNNPTSAHGKMLSDLCKSIGNSTSTGYFVRYVPMVGITGTSPSRDYMIRQARGEFVLCVDSHVMFEPQSIDSLLHWLVYGLPSKRSIYSGVMLYDVLDEKNDSKQTVTDNFYPKWEREMWGRWCCTWQRPQEKELFVVIPSGDRKNGNAIACQNTIACSPIKNHPVNNAQLPFEGHESALRRMGYWRLVEIADMPYPVIGHGLGCFGVFRDSWLGFHSLSRGFGGEELYIHEKYRRNNGQAICLPFLRWLHRFGRPEGAPYPAPLFDKVRNYVLEFQEMGWDTAPIKQHFVDSGRMSATTWHLLCADPVNMTTDHLSGRKSKRERKPVSLSRVASEIQRIQPSEVTHHFDKIKECSQEANCVVDLSFGYESVIAHMCAGAKVIHHKMQYDNKHTINAKSAYKGDLLPCPDSPISCDVLFVSEDNTSHKRYELLKSWGEHVSRFIVMHNTFRYRMKGDVPESPGVYRGMALFLQQFPEWSICYHDDSHGGLTVLAKRDEDKPKPPSMFAMASNLLASAASIITAHNTGLLDETTYKTRLAVCSMCEFRRNEQCTLCGCYIPLKMKFAGESCPDNRYAREEFWNPAESYVKENHS